MTSVRALIGTAIMGFQGDYSLSQKEPDAFISANAQRFPRIAVETGWSESMPRLEADMRLWLLGARAHVERVIILKWSKIVRQRIKGSVSVYGRDEAGNPIRLQKLVYNLPLLLFPWVCLY